MRIGRPLQIIIGITIAIAGLAVFFRNVDIGRLGHELAMMSLWVVALNIATQILTLWFRGLRLRLFLPASPNTHTRGLFQNAAIGFMLNNIFPARAGEAARVVLLWRQNGYSPFTGLGALLVERIWDVVTLSSFFIIPVLILPSLSGLHRVAGLMGLGCCAWIAFLVGHALFPRLVLRTCTTLTRLLPAKIRVLADRILKELLSSLDWCRSPWRFGAAIILSLATELCYGVGLAALIGGAAVDALVRGIFAQSLCAVGAAIPLAPGYVGTLHAFLLKGLVMVGVMEEKARAAAIVFHACGYVSVTVLGLVLMMKMKISLKEMSKAKVEVPAEKQETDRISP